MPIIRVVDGTQESKDCERLVPGSRVAYRGTPWKVVGMYYAAEGHGGHGGHRTIAAVPERTKYLILQSLSLQPEALRYPG